MIMVDGSCAWRTAALCVLGGTWYVMVCARDEDKDAVYEVHDTIRICCVCENLQHVPNERLLLLLCASH